MFLLADLEEEMRRKGWGGVKLGTKKVYTLAYADDMAIMTKDTEEKRVDGKSKTVFKGERTEDKCKQTRNNEM